MTTPTSSVKSSSDPKRKYQCTLCSYAATLPSLLSRHINQKHGEARAVVKHELINILDKVDSVPDMLEALSKWLKNGNSFSGALPPEVITRMKQEDARMNIALKLVAVAKIQRVLEQGQILDSLDRKLKLKLEDKESMKDVGVGGLQSMVTSTQASVKSDIDLVKDLLAVGQIDLSDTIKTLSELFTGQNFVSAQLNLQASQVPVSPAKRERLRIIAAEFYANSGQPGSPATRTLGSGEATSSPAP